MFWDGALMHPLLLPIVDRLVTHIHLKCHTLINNPHVSVALIPLQYLRSLMTSSFLINDRGGLHTYLQLLATGTDKPIWVYQMTSEFESGGPHDTPHKGHWQGPFAPARQAIEFQLQRNGTHVRW